VISVSSSRLVGWISGDMDRPLRLANLEKSVDDLRRDRDPGEMESCQNLLQCTKKTKSSNKMHPKSSNNHPKSSKIIKQNQQSTSMHQWTNTF
jgi:hypothetical protein